ncbi:hypothetical protein M2325_000641 [Methanococcus voltae PS]|uniref:Protein NO VEIN C-terminal domain-containing protein n=1 Tax=Methanococcus voltae PS TaxID=523842 RepID=A0ABT2EX09_METVO|nr:DUF3883 domain-containing protein [Methanococcus voltae]MCS3921956.1 hypothetical protein [Methanococcus voltae PS]
MEFKINNEIIDKIREDFKNINSHEENTYANFMDNVSKIVKTIFSEETQFIYELIQNADDNTYPTDSKPFLRFKLYNDKLIIENNEVGFLDENVKALCNIGGSTKKSGDYIGEKGVGFKSVFAISNSPEIYSNNKAFKFDYNKEEPKSLLYPHKINKIPDYVQDTSITTMVLPFSVNRYNEIKKYMDMIESSILIYLKKLESIEIYNEIYGHKKVYKKIKGVNNTLKIYENEKETKWKLFEEIINVPEDINDGRDNHQTKISMALPLINKLETQKFYNYLPIKDYGFKFIINADFILNASRDDIPKTVKWNIHLRDNLSEIFVKNIENFKEDPDLKLFYKYLPIKQEITDNFFKPVVTAIYKQMQKINCIYTEDENWKKPSEVKRTKNKDEIREILTNEELMHHFKLEYLNSSVQPKLLKEVSSELGLDLFDDYKLFDYLNNEKKDNILRKGNEWFVNLYKYLEDSKLPLDLIKKLPLIPLENNTLSNCNKDNIYFPLSESKGYSFENKLRIIKKDIGNNKEVTTFLKNYGLIEPKPENIVKSHILKYYENLGENPVINESLSKSYIAYITDNLNNMDEELFEEIKWNLLVITEDNQYCVIGNTYLSNYYNNPDYGQYYDLEKLFEGIKVPFLSKKYMKKNNINNVLKFKDLHKKLKDVEGNTKKNRQKAKYKNQISKIINKNTLKDVELLDFFQAFSNSIPLVKKEEEIAHKTRDKNNFRKYTKLSSPDIIAILDNINIEKSKILFKILEENQDYYMDRSKYTHKFFYRKWNEKKCISDWYSKLLNSKWININSELEYAQNIYTDKDEGLKKTLGNDVKYIKDISKDFAEFLGINSEITSKSLLNILYSLNDRKDTNTDKYRKYLSSLQKLFEIKADDELIKELKENFKVYLHSKNKFYSMNELYWEDCSYLFEDCIGISKEYPKLKNLFVNILKINQRVEATIIINKLKEVSKLKPTSENENMIFKCYEELNTQITNKLINETDLNKYLENIKLLCENGKFKKISEIYYGDNFNLQKKFDSEKFNFLKYPKDKNISKFLENVSFNKLSENVLEQICCKYDIHDEYSKKYQILSEYVCRYCYWKKTEYYDKLLADNILQKILNISVNTSENLKVNYALENENYIDYPNIYVSNNFEIILDKNTILSQNYEEINNLLCKKIQEKIGLESFVNYMFLKSETETENYALKSGVKKLPADKLYELDHIISNMTTPESNISEVLPNSVIEPISSINKVENSQNPEKIINSTQFKASDKPKITKTHTSKTKNIDTDTCEENSKSTKESIRLNSTTSNNKSSKKNNLNIEEFEDVYSVPLRYEEYIPAHVDEISSKTKSKKPSSIKNTKENIIETGEKNIKVDKKYLDAIGYWSEHYYLRILLDTLKNTDGTIDKKSDGEYIIYKNDQEYAKVRWLNSGSDVGEGRDFDVIVNGKTYYFEIKSTTTTNDWFDISKKQWDYAKIYGDDYIIGLVLNATKNNAVAKWVQNPYKLWREGKLIANPVNIKF